jgi:hypothetical protein
MGESTATTTVGPVTFEDVSGQNRKRVSGIPTDAQVSEVVKRLLADMHLPDADAEGRPVTYTARLEREARHLGGNERIGDVVEPGDNLRLLPSIEAG